MVLAAKKQPAHHKQLRPKHKHTPDYLKSYWPYLPLLLMVIIAMVIVRPIHSKNGVLAYATDMSIDGLLSATNTQRQAQSEQPLTLNSQLANAAQAKAQDMAAKNYWSHTTPDGSAPWIFVTQNGYNYKKAGENLGYGFLDSNALVTGWMNSPSHRANILDNNYSEVGFGFAQSNNYNNTGPATIVVAMYGQPIAQTIGTNVTSNDSQSQGYSTTHATEPTSKTITKIQTLNSSLGPWAPYAIGAVIGTAVTFLVVKHGRRIKRMIVHGEKFALHHPLLDTTLVSIAVLGLLVIQQAGIIR